MLKLLWIRSWQELWILILRCGHTSMLLCDSSNFASIETGLLGILHGNVYFFGAAELLQVSVANKVLHQILWLIESSS